MYDDTYRMAGKFDGLTFFVLTIKLISVNVNFPSNFPYTMCLLTAHFVKLKSVIFLLCNLEAISSNFIPVKFPAIRYSLSSLNNSVVLG